MMKKNIILSIIITVCILLTSCSTLKEDDKEPFDPLESSIFRMAEVKNVRILEKTEVKSGASENYNTIAVLNRGDVVRVLGKVDNWYVIRLENYRIGCIDAAKTEPVVVDSRNSRTPEQATEPEGGNTDEGTDQETEPQAQPQKPAPDPVENVDSQQEGQLLNLINQERARNGLPGLRLDPELTRVARIKAQDMIDNNYFSHYSPTYGSPFDMMNEFNIKYQYAGENIAQNTSVNKAHTALMNSSGHRKNILNPNFTHIGIGIKKAKKGYIYVEMFIGVPK